MDDFSDSYKDEYEACKAKYSSKNVEFYINECGKSAGGARNTGLKYAKGKWLLFADADDIFLPDFYSILQKYFVQEYDIVYFVPTSIDLMTGQETVRHRSYQRYVCNYLDNPSLRNLMLLKYCYESPWSKLIKRSLLTENNIFFDQTMYSNDVMASVKSAYYAKKILPSREKIYCITKRGNSLTSSVTQEKYNIRLNAYFRKHSFLKKHLTKEEYQAMDFKVRLRLGAIVDNKWGIGFLFITTCRLLLHGVPIWREYGPLKGFYNKQIEKYL